MIFLNHERLTPRLGHAAVVAVVLILCLSFILPLAPHQGVRVPSRPGVAPRFAAAGASSGYWYGGASSTDSSALPNSGVEGAIQVVPQEVSGCLSFWVADDASNNVWGQVGYYICSGSTPVAFYQIWNLNSNTILTTGVTSVSAGTHTFSMYLQQGTVWAYALDGVVFGTYDMGAAVSSSSYPVYALSEEGGVSSTFQFSSVTFPTAMDVYKNGGWGAVSTANAYGGSWGVQGNLQNPALNVDEMIVGGTLPTLSTVPLWNSLATTTTSSSTTQTTTSSSTTTATTTTATTTTSTTTSQTTTGVTSVVLDGNTAASAGVLSQYLSKVYVGTGSPVGINVDWYVDGTLQWSVATGEGSGPTPVGWTWFNEYWTSGTHTIYAVAGGVQSNTLTVVASSGSTTTTTTTITTATTTTSTTTSQTTTGVTSVVLDGNTAASAGVLSQYLSKVYVGTGSPVGINVDWYVDGTLQWSVATGEGSGPTPVGWTWFNEYWTSGTHTIYAVAGGVQSNTLTVVASSGSTTTTTTTITTATTTTSTTTSQTTTGVTSVVLDGNTAASAGVLSQYLSKVYVGTGSPVGINVDWYVDGTLQWSVATGEGSGPTPVGWTWFNEYWTSGTHTIYAVAGGVQSNTLLVVVP